MKKDQSLPKKNFTVLIVQENHFQITIIPLDNIHFTETKQKQMIKK